MMASKIIFTYKEVPTKRQDGREMANKVRLWDVSSDRQPIEIPDKEISLEERLENWLASDISMLDPDLIVIGRQVATDFRGYIDLLCLDSSGDVVVVELKRGQTPRE